MRRRILVGAFVMLSTAAAWAQKPDSGAFIIRLGNDTVAVERYVRTGNRLMAEAVQRSPTTMFHRIVYVLDAQNRVVGTEWSQHRPGVDAPVARRIITPRGDTLVIENVQGTNSRTQRTLAAGSIPIVGPFYTPYELAVIRRLATGGGSDRVIMLAGADTVSIPVARLGADSVTLTNQFGEPMRARVDATGRILYLHTPAYTTVERVPSVDLERLAREFAARDETGRGMGMLSPRHTYRARVGGANVWVDYSRPGARGRPIWGALVPWDATWRTGANDAAHFSTDKTIELGNLTLQPGTYTLFLHPGRTEWKLIVNRQSGISGLGRDPAQDAGSIVMDVETMTQPHEQFTIAVSEANGTGRLAFSWDRTRASVPLRVPLVIGASGLKPLRWIEGKWKGSGGGHDAFYERYRFESDAKLIVEAFADATFSKPTETSVYEIHSGRLISSNESHVASLFTDRAVTFVPVRTGNTYTWERVGDNEWRAVLDNPATASAPARTVTYKLVRVP